MLAKAATKLPTGDGCFYEPKWDGFRCIVFRDGDEVELGSRNERPLTRYFPEVVEAVKAHLPERCVVDGEIVVPRGDRLDFESLLQRIHPAESRVATAGRADAGVLRRLRPAGPRRRVAAGHALRASGGRGCETALAGARPPVYLTHGHPGRRDRRERWFDDVRGRRPRRRRRQAPRTCRTAPTSG